MAFGEGKAPVVARAVEGPVTAEVAASFLQEHPNAVVVLDDAAAAQLTRSKTPWLLGPGGLDAGGRSARPSSGSPRTSKKPMLKLTDEDYNEHGLQELLAAHGPAYDINIEVFRDDAGDDHRLARRQARIARAAPTDIVRPQGRSVSPSAC